MELASKAPQILFKIKVYEKDEWVSALTLAQEAGFLVFNAAPKGEKGAILLDHILMASNMKTIFDEVLSEFNNPGHRDDLSGSVGGQDSQPSTREGLVGSGEAAPEVESKTEPGDNMDAGQSDSTDDFIGQALS